MKKVYFLLCLFLGHAAFAQVGLSGRESRRLKGWIRTDASVRRIVDSLQGIADAALADEPNPIDTIRTEGLLQGDPRKTATWEALRDLHKMYALAVAYRVTGRREYLDKTTVYLVA